MSSALHSLLASNNPQTSAHPPTHPPTNTGQVHSVKMGAALERMVNQNAEDEIFQDFKYWEDASDAFREGEGSLLPLWRFSTERSKRKQVRETVQPGRCTHVASLCSIVISFLTSINPSSFR